MAYQAAILCHYVADLNVPLHTTSNYDGQTTGQKGVHHRWETGLVQRLGGWRPEVRPADLGQDAWYAPWTWLGDSCDLVAAVLGDDLAASQGESLELKEPGPGYWQAFERLQMPVVKTRLTLAAQRTARMILLAWTRAGQPALKAAATRSAAVHFLAGPRRSTFKATRTQIDRPGSETRQEPAS